MKLPPCCHVQVPLCIPVVIERVELRAVGRVDAVGPGRPIAERRVVLCVRGLDPREVGLERDRRVVRPARSVSGLVNSTGDGCSSRSRNAFGSCPASPLRYDCPSQSSSALKQPLIMDQRRVRARNAEVVAVVLVQAALVLAARDGAVEVRVELRGSSRSARSRPTSPRCRCVPTTCCHAGWPSSTPGGTRTAPAGTWSSSACTGCARTRWPPKRSWSRSDGSSGRSRSILNPAGVSCMWMRIRSPGLINRSLVRVGIDRAEVRSVERAGEQRVRRRLGLTAPVM